MSYDDMDDGRLPERQDDRASSVEPDAEHEYENVKGCLTLMGVIVAFLAAAIGFAVLTKNL